MPKLSSSTPDAGGAAIAWADNLFVQGSTGYVGIGTTTPGFPLNFADTFGDKISLLGSSGNHWGFGIQTQLMQVYAATSSGDIAFGYGQSSSFTENMRVKGNGRVGIGTSSPGNNSLTVDAGTRPTAAEFDCATAGGVAVVANATASTGNSVAGDFSTDSTAGTAVYAIASTTSGTTYGVRGITSSTAAGAAGVRGEAPSSANTNYGVYGQAAGANAYGVYANGRLGSSGTKSFVIDHPLDPEHKVLIHYSAESPEVLNIYSGNVVLDGDGAAWIDLPDYFDTINTDPRYQLTPIGAPAPMLYVADREHDNRFRIAGGVPGMEVSWEVKARRNDRFVVMRGAPIERVKTGFEQGRYIDPSLYAKPAEMGIFFSPAPQRPGEAPEAVAGR